MWRNSGNLGLGILNTIPKVFNTVSSFVSDSLVNLFSSFYTLEVEKTKTNKLIKGFGVVVFICAIGITFFTLKENYDGSNVTESVSVVKEKPKKLEELSKKYNISRERVRQIEEKAIEKIQKQISQSS